MTAFEPTIDATWDELIERLITSRWTHAQPAVTAERTAFVFSFGIRRREDSRGGGIGLGSASDQWKISRR